MSYINFLAKDKNILPYRKELNQITGSVTATLLLQQLIYWDDKSNNKPFYKFIEPCNHEKYAEGDSWVEELGFSKYEFKAAYKKLEDLKIISKKTDRTRVTFYTLQHTVLAKLIKPIYLSGKNQSTKVEKTNLDYSKNSNITETTTETTTEIVTPAKTAPLSQFFSDSTEIANYLLQKIMHYKPNSTPPNESSMQVWVSDIEKSIRIDKRTKEELIGCISWIYGTKDGEFWISNIRSGKKLREKFDTMESQMMRSKQHKSAKAISNWVPQDPFTGETYHAK